MLILAGHQLIKCCVRGFNKLIFRYCVYTHMVSRLSLGLFQRKLITTLGAIAIFAHSNLTQTTGLPYLKFPTGYKVFRSATTDMYKTKEPMLFLCACNFSWMQEHEAKTMHDLPDPRHNGLVEAHTKLIAIFKRMSRQSIPGLHVSIVQY